MNEKLKFEGPIFPHKQLEINKSIILNYLKNNPMVTRAQISREIKISAPTVSKIVGSLIKEKRISAVVGKGSSFKQKSVKLVFNHKKESIIGIDLGKDNIKIARFNLINDVFEKHTGFKIQSNDKNLLKKTIDEIKLFINNIDKNKLNETPIKLICISVPANIDFHSGKVISASLFKGWNNLNLGEIFNKEFKIETIVENSSNLSVVGEKYFGIGKEYKNIILLDIGEGIGAGIMINNTLYRGSSYSAGEVGYMIIDKENLYSVFENKGYIEMNFSPRKFPEAIIRAIKQDAKTIVNEIVNGNIEKITPEIVCRASYLGDELSKSIIKDCMENLSILIINLVLFFNPEIIIVGGDFAELPHIDKLFIEPIKINLKRVVPFKLPEIEISQLGSDIGVIGAGAYANDYLLTNSYPFSI